MRTPRLQAIAGFIILLFPITNYSQAPDLGVASTFALFTAVGAFNGDLGTTVIGDIGTNVGAFTPPGNHIGQVHVANAISAQAATDVMNAYAFVDGLTCGTVLGSTLGNGQVLGPGIYCTIGASTLMGDLILDAQGDPNAIFIFQIDGALSTATLSNIVLINGANMCNVYGQVNGAVELGVNSLFQGNIIANGAINLLSGAVLLGRGLSTAGAISTNANLVQLPAACNCSLMITCPPVAGGTFDCAADIPAPDENLITIIDSCGIVTITMSDDTTGTGCGMDTMFVTRQYIITDSINLDTCTQVFKAVDDDVPVLMNCPASITVACDNLVPAPSISGIIATDNCDASVTITFVPDIVSNQTCADRYTLLRIYRATDDCGNSATCAQTITVLDNTIPLITCPANVTVQCAALVPAVNLALVVTSDNCGGGATVTFVSDVTSNMTCANRFTVTRTYRATDACGNSATCAQTITVLDNTVPLITCPANVTVQCAPLVPPVNLALVVTSDNCGGGATVTFVSDVTSNMTCPNRFTVTRTYRATDACGNSATCAQTITVFDNTIPVITCPANVTVQCAPLVPPVNIALVVTSDNCGGSPTVTFVGDVTSNMTCPNRFTVTRTYRATDACGNSATCAQTITVLDNTVPLITCPANVTVQCAPLVPPVDIALVVTSDNCGGSATVTFVGDVTSNMTCANRFTVTRTYRATDACGNSATCNQTITVFDNTIPTLTCPAAVTVQCASQVPAPTPASVIAADNCMGVPTVTFVADVTTNMTCANRFTVTRTYRATDECGNSATCNQTITVFDNTIPTLTCPAAVTVQCASLVPAPTPASVIAADNCMGIPTVTFVADVTTNMTCVNRFTVTRTYRATDECGNSATCNQNITVFDNTIPVITCPLDVTVQCASLVPPVNIAAVVATDNCGGTPTITFVADVTTNMTCVNRFTVTRTYRATDACGNSSTCNQTITVFDNTIPIITCPLDVTVQCASLVPPVNIAAVVATDNCGGAPTVTFVADVTTNMTCVNRFTVTRTYRATDACGNSATCAQTITVFDNTPPTITCPVNVTVQCANLVPAVNIAAVISADNCGGVTTITHVGDAVSNMTCINRFILTRTYRATDVCGNSATCAQVITVFDNTAPAITCPVNVTVQCASQVPPVNIAAVITSDNCGGTVTVTNISNVITNQTCVNRFILTRTYRATDACGNSATCAQVITVFDNTPPSIDLTELGVPNGGTIEVQCMGQDPNWEIPVFDEGSINATDNCGGNVTIAFNQVLQDEGNCSVDGYIMLYRLTWSVLDVCGNSSTAFVFLALIDTIPPVIQGVPDDITINCDEIPEPPVAVYATDECLCACVVLFQETIPIVGCQDGQVITRSWTARDDCGNETIEIQNITLIDDEGPEFQMMQPEIANITDGTILEYTCNEGGFPAFFDLLNVGSVFSPVTCGSAPVITFERDNIVANNCEFFGFAEQQTFRWEGVDLCGNETSFTLVARLIDNEAPILIGVPDTACIGDPSLANVDASDNCGAPSIRFWDVSILNPCGTGIAMRRTYEAYDDCGNIATDTTILIPNDQTLSIGFVNPVLANLGDDEILVVDCSANGGNYTSFGIGDVSIEDMCPGGTTISFSEIIIDDGDDIPGGIIAIIELHWLATDVCGNSSELVVTTHIITQPGGTGPVFVNFSSGVSIGCDDELPEIFIMDNGGGEVSMTIVDSIVYGNCPFEYNILRFITATDVCGRTTTKTQNVHVGGSGPVIEGLELEICDDLTIPEVTAYDECADEFVEVTMVQDTLDIHCRDGLVIERTWTAIDTCGNVTEIIQTIIMEDQTPPEILIPTNSVIRRFMDNGYNLIFFSQFDLVERLDGLNENSLFVTDECDLEIIPVFTVDTIMGDCEVDGFLQRRVYTWVATDVCGNSDSVSFSVDIMDDIAPVINGLPNDTTLICVPLGLPPVLQVQDIAQPVTIVYSETIEEGEVPGSFIVIRRWVATDDCGNSSEVTQRINWIPDTFLECDIIVPPLVECNSQGVIISSLMSGGLGAISYNWEIVGEKCFIQAGQGTPELLIYVGFSDVKIILTVTDEFGCVSMCMVTINCLDAAEIPLANLSRPAPNKSVHQHIDAVNGEKMEYLSQFSIWPNPVSGNINLSFESAVDEELTMSFVNILGQVALSRDIIAKKGFNSFKIDVSDIPNGSYFIRINTENEFHSIVIIKQ